MKITQLEEHAPTHSPDDLCAAARAWREQQTQPGNVQLNLGARDWQLYPEVAVETQVYPSNNDAGRVKTGLLLRGLENVVIEGNGARLVVRGSPLAGRGRTTVLDAPMLPIVIENSENVTIRNLSLDWETPAVIQGTCCKVEGTSFEVDLETRQKISCFNDQLYVQGEGWTWPVRRLLAVDQKTGEVQRGSGDNFGVGYDVTWSYQLVAPLRIRISGPAGGRPALGAVVLFWCSNHDTGARRSPGIFVSNSRNVLLENLRLNFSWGMGVIAQNTRDITLRNVVVEPSADRKFSLACDGSHFVACRGKVLIENCRFQNQFDDAVNAHGLYYQLVRQLGPRSLRVRIVHPQHQGVVAFRTGDRISFQPRPYLVPVGEAMISALSSPNSETVDLGFEQDVPPGLPAGSMLENLSAYPEITIRDCTIRWNRARGILLNGRGRIVVERNRFETAGSAILIESSPIWGESGPIGEMIVRDNVFSNCAHTPMWGKAVIQGLPEFREGAPADLPPFHGTLALSRNRFENCAAPELAVESFARVTRN